MKQMPLSGEWVEHRVGGGGRHKESLTGVFLRRSGPRSAVVDFNGSIKTVSLFHLTVVPDPAQIEAAKHGIRKKHGHLPVASLADD